MLLQSGLTSEEFDNIDIDHPAVEEIRKAAVEKWSPKYFYNRMADFMGSLLTGFTWIYLGLSIVFVGFAIYASFNRAEPAPLHLLWWLVAAHVIYWLAVFTWSIIGVLLTWAAPGAPRESRLSLNQSLPSNEQWELRKMNRESSL